MLAGLWVQGLVPGAKRHRGCCCARAGARLAPGWLVPARFRVPGGDLAVPGSPVGGVTAAPSHPPQQQVKRRGSGTGKPRFLVSRRHRKRAAASRHAANRSPHSSPAAPRPSWGREAPELQHPHGTAAWAACCPCAHPLCSAVFAAPSCGASPLVSLSGTTVPRAVRCRRLVTGAGGMRPRPGHGEGRMQGCCSLPLPLLIPSPRPCCDPAPGLPVVCGEALRAEIWWQKWHGGVGGSSPWVPSSPAPL